MSLDSTLRIGDTERERVVAALGQHLSLGHLTMDEFESRLDTVYTAGTHRELDAALVDLPTEGVATDAPSATQRRLRAGAPWTPEGWMLWAPWALTVTICLVIWVSTSVAQGHPLYFWPFCAIGPWGAILLAHAAMAHNQPLIDRS